MDEISVEMKTDNPLLQCLLPAAQWLLHRFFLLDRVNETYARVQMRAGEDLPFMERALEELQVSYRLLERDFERIPAKGPVVVVANHPYGGVEGIIFAAVLQSVRPDVKIMANYLLRHFKNPEFLKSFIFVDPFGGAESFRANVKPLRETMEWVREDGMLGVFPAGEVSHFSLRKREIGDPPWNATVARIVRKTGASVLPLYFGGRNSLLFQVLGLIHPRLRTLMLPHEVYNKENHIVPVRVGRLISFDKCNKFESDEEMMSYLRLRTYLLKNRKGEDEGRRVFFFGGRPVARAQESVVAAQPRERIREEVAALPKEQKLVDTERFAVYRAEAAQIPCILQEIGRLRELTFREAGEGTGKSIDLDRFDMDYTHLFLWSKTAGELVGGYRMGLTDRILARNGKGGLYTSTLFDYRPGLLERLGPAIELGRSWVRPEYQKTYQPLLMLWKGIGRFVCANPQYKVFFGPVSINNDYLSISRQLIVTFSKNNHRAELAGLVRGNGGLRRSPLNGRRIRDACTLVQDIQDLSELISDIERDQKGIPILFKHYMKLGGEFLGFTVDRNFSDVMDVLILVDLTRTDPRVLERYMGKEGLETFMRYHHETESPAMCAA